MFDRDQALARWRKDFAARSGVSKDDLDELESHLLDQADDFEHKGLSEEEAFALSAWRLGSSEEIQTEFAKQRSSLLVRQRLVWGLAGILGFLLVLRLGAVAYQILSSWYIGVVRPDPGANSFDFESCQLAHALSVALPYGAQHDGRGGMNL